MAGKCRRFNTTFYLLLFIVLSPRILRVNGDGGNPRTQNGPEGPSFAKVVADTISLLRKSHKSPWEKIKTIIHDIQLQYFPPNIDFRSADEANVREVNGGSGAGERMKDAAEKSFVTSKQTAESSAKSVAETVHKTADKMKEKLSSDEATHDEL